MATLRKTINSQEKLVEYCQELTDFWWEHRYINVSATDKRNLDQNALQFFWYEQMEEQGDMSREEYRNKCKLKFGIPILVQNPEFSWIMTVLKSVDWDQAAIDSGKSVQECKEEFVGNMEITSRMSTDEMKRYLDGIKTHFEPLGFYLPTNKDRKREASEAVAKK